MRTSSWAAVPPAVIAGPGICDELRVDSSAPCGRFRRVVRSPEGLRQQRRVELGIVRESTPGGAHVVVGALSEAGRLAVDDLVRFEEAGCSGESASHAGWSFHVPRVVQYTRGKLVPI